MQTYAITFTTATPGFDDAQVLIITDWCRRNSDACFLVEEQAATRHLHAAFRCKQKSTHQVSRKLETLYKKMELPWVTKISCKVKRMCELIGWFHYLKKDLGDNEPLLLTGWQMTWITKQCQENVKKIPHKTLLKNDYQLSTKTSTAMVIQYASAHNMLLCDKFSFADVLAAMAADSYTFESVRVKWLFCQVMARQGHPRYMKAHVLNELSFIEG